MNSRLMFLEVLLPVLSQLSRSPNQGLAAEAAEEVAVKSKERARLLKQAAAASAEASTEGAGAKPAMAA